MGLAAVSDFEICSSRPLHFLIKIRWQCQILLVASAAGLIQRFLPEGCKLVFLFSQRAVCDLHCAVLILLRAGFRKLVS